MADKTPQKPAPWFDEKSNAPLLAERAQSLQTFVAALADGLVDDAELKAQEDRLVKIMKEVEPQLNPGQHEAVTRLLVELTAYDMMRMMHEMQKARISAFRG